MRACRPIVLVLASVFAVACSSGSDAPTPAQADPAGALEALPPCTGPPAAAADDVDGLLLPGRSTIVSVEEQGPLTNVTAFVPLTPVAFEQAMKSGDLQILISENEIFEAELLVSDGSYRNFMKATASCREGSNVLVVVAPEVDASGLPVPRGAAPTP